MRIIPQGQVGELDNIVCRWAHNWYIKERQTQAAVMKPCRYESAMTRPFHPLDINIVLHRDPNSDMAAILVSLEGKS